MCGELVQRHRVSTKASFLGCFAGLDALPPHPHALGRISSVYSHLFGLVLPPLEQASGAVERASFPGVPTGLGPEGIALPARRNNAEIRLRVFGLELEECPPLLPSGGPIPENLLVTCLLISLPS